MDEGQCTFVHLRFLPLKGDGVTFAKVWPIFFAYAVRASIEPP